jgi:hypothetical protein
LADPTKMVRIRISNTGSKIAYVIIHLSSTYIFYVSLEMSHYLNWLPVYTYLFLLVLGYRLSLFLIFSVSLFGTETRPSPPPLQNDSTPLPQ